MQKTEFVLRTEYIDLLQLLKASGIAMSGGEAKMFVNEGLITVNEIPESRKRRKLRSGDVVEFDGEHKIFIITE
ncbi:MAG: RNA-binding protein [Bacteroidetes bacterium]|nr:MAG: RNA-binding protein [Bacteroidota bacterium]